jgi:arylformamidase
VVVDLSHEVVAERFGKGAGTCLHSPFHVDAGRADLAHLPLERLVNVPIVVVRAYAEREVTADHLGDPGLLWGRAVLVHTGWARRWGTGAYLEPDSPHLTAAAIEILVGANVALVGIDSGTIDDPTDAAGRARHALLGADIPIVEHLTNLDLLPDAGAQLIALPPPVRGMASCPIRAVAVLPA